MAARKYRIRAAFSVLTGVTLLGFSPIAVAQSVPASAGSALPAAGTPAKPQVVLPRLLYLAEVDSPARAALTAPLSVKLKVLVREDGSVGDAVALESDGPGPDGAVALRAAALEALRRSVFTPALVGGRAREVYIPFTYVFEPPSSESPPPAVTALAAAAGGNLEGRLLIAGSEEPLPGAVVTVIAEGGIGYEAISDENGAWSLVGLPPSQYEVVVSADGYEPLTTTEEVSLGEATALTLRLSPRSEIDEVIVVGERPPREVTRRTLDRREISKVPGTGGDALRSLQSLPGVARPPGLAGVLIVRGSAPQDTQGLVDGTLVPLIYHFGGLSSVIPTELLDRIDFYPGNFGVKYGRAMAGIVDVKLRSPETECTADYGVPSDESGCFHGMVQGDLIDTRFFLRGPLGDKWTFAVGGRRSWVDVWLKPVLEQAGAGVSAAPVYNDYQLIAETHPTRRSKLRLQFYGTDDALKILVSEPSAQEPAFSGTLSFANAFYRGQAVYEHQFTPKLEMAATASFGRDRVRFSLGPVLFNLDSYPLVQRTELGWTLTDGVKVNVGMDLLSTFFDVRVRAPLPPDPSDNTPRVISSEPVLETESTGAFFQPAAYADFELQPTERWLIVPGARVDYNNQNEQTNLSPRVTARYTLRGIDSDADSDGVVPLKTVVKGGAGLFYQPPQPQQLDPIFGTWGVQSNRSAHFSVGVEQGLSEFLDVSLEAYLKELDNLVVGGSPYTNQGSGRVIGAETLLRYKSDGRFFGWLAYTLSKSTRRSAPDEAERPFQFDQTHILTALGSYRLGGGWELGARFRIVSGNNYTPVRTGAQVPSIYVADVGSYVPIQGQLNSRRLPLFNQLDVRIEKTWQFRDFRVVGYVDVWNAYNNAAVEGVSYNFDYSKSTVQTGLPIIPSLGLRGEF